MAKKKATRKKATKKKAKRKTRSGLTSHERKRIEERMELAVGIEQRAAKDIAPSELELHNLIIGWIAAGKDLARQSSLTDSDNEMVSKLFHACQDAVIEVATLLNMDADRLLQDRSGDSVLWRQLHAKSRRMRRSRLEQPEHWKPRTPQNGDVQLLCLYLKEGLDLGLSQAGVLRRYVADIDGMTTKKADSLMGQAKRFRHLWDNRD